MKGDIIRRDGTRTIMGNNHGVCAIVRREGKSRWSVTWGVCNGIAGGYLVYRTRREAVAAAE